MSDALKLLTIYGARSGIQKAIRRGDPSLSKTCFDIIWPETEHRNWLMWRLPVLVFEDCWTMAGELAKAQNNARGLSGDKLREHWLKFIIRLTIAVKNQDAAWLWYIAAKDTKPYPNPEFAAMKEIADRIPDDKPAKLPRVVVDEIISRYATHELTDYELDACSVIEGRRTSGGMASDQWNALAAQVLIHVRGLPEEPVLAMIESQRELYRGDRISTLDSLPWYCFDMHTRPGLMAMRVWLKNYKTSLFCDEDHIMTAWFQFESAKVGPKVLAKATKFSPNSSDIADWKTSMWLHEKVDSLARWYGVSSQELMQKWGESVGKVEDLVVWALKKSS